MSDLNLGKLHVKFIGEADPEGPTSPRKYTLTHSDTTGDLFLSVGANYDQAAISSFYTRIMRDEVLAELIKGADGSELHAYCHVSGGLVVGSAGWRYAIFQRHMRQILQALRYGDEIFCQRHPHLDKARVFVHFRSENQRYNLQENWGYLSNYVLQERLIYATA